MTPASSEAKPKCKTHGTFLEDTDCPRCRGNGYTDSDIEELDNPASWHDGRCHTCGGTGEVKEWYCPDCEVEDD